MQDDIDMRAVARLVSFPIINQSLSNALLIGLVRRGVISPDDARDIIIEALKAIHAFFEDKPNGDMKSAALEHATSFLNALLENPVIKGTAE
jgi:hypothetical protein